jgi:hypothetical protein
MSVDIPTENAGRSPAADVSRSEYTLTGRASGLASSVSLPARAKSDSRWPWCLSAE